MQACKAGCGPAFSVPRRWCGVTASSARAPARCWRPVGLDVAPDTMPDALSYGALKRLELARSLMNEPTLLLLDEPAAGLNPREKIEMGRLIEQLASQRITVVLIEHDMKLVMGVSDHVVVLNYGRRIAQGTPHEVARDPDVIAAYLGTRR